MGNSVRPVNKKKAFMGAIRKKTGIWKSPRGVSGRHPPPKSISSKAVPLFRRMPRPARAMGTGSPCRGMTRATAYPATMGSALLLSWVRRRSFPVGLSILPEDRGNNGSGQVGPEVQDEARTGLGNYFGGGPRTFVEHAPVCCLVACRLLPCRCRQKRLYFREGDVDLLHLLFRLVPQPRVMGKSVGVPYIDDILVGLPRVFKGRVWGKIKDLKTSLQIHGRLR